MGRRAERDARLPARPDRPVRLVTESGKSCGLFNLKEILKAVITLQDEVHRPAGEWLPRPSLDVVEPEEPFFSMNF